MKRAALALVLFFGFGVGLAQAAIGSDFDTFKGDISADLGSVAQWLSDTMAPHIAFNAGSGGKIPANVMAVPGFEFGIETGAAFFPFDASSLKTLVYSNGIYPATGLDLSAIPSYLALPSFAGVHAKVGLITLPVMGAIDLGVRAGYGSFTQSGVSYSSTNWGAELRSQFVKDDLTSPCGLSLNLGVSGATGTMSADLKSVSQSYTGYPNGAPNSSMTLSSKANMSWNPLTLSVLGMVSKKLVAINPFAGVGVDFNTGSISTTVSNSATLTEGAQSVSGSFDVSKSSPPPASSFRGVLGFELDSMIDWLLYGETNGKDISANLGARIQF